jgi:hypothetical protein
MTIELQGWVKLGDDYEYQEEEKAFRKVKKDIIGALSPVD